MLLSSCTYMSKALCQIPLSAVDTFEGLVTDDTADEVVYFEQVS